MKKITFRLTLWLRNILSHLVKKLDKKITQKVIKSVDGGEMFSVKVNSDAKPIGYFVWNGSDEGKIFLNNK